MPDIQPIRFAVVGCGHIGKRHAEMIRRTAGADLVALCDSRPQAELNLPAGNEVPFFRNMEEMLQALPGIEVVNICTPNGLHADQAMLALQYQKHVVCEKPMGLSASKCEAVISKALQKSRQVFCVMQNRYSPPSAWIKEIVDSGKLGDIYFVQLNCYWNRDERYYKSDDPHHWKGSLKLDGGTLFTQFSHFVDIMYWLFGDIADIKGTFADYSHQDMTDFEDTGSVNFRFLNGGMGCLNYSTSVWDRNFESSITIIGSKGAVKLGGQYMDKVEYCHIKDYEMPELQASLPPNDYGAYKGSAANHHFVIENVVDTLRGTTTATTNALEGMKVVDIIERIYAVRDQSFTKRRSHQHAE